MAGTLDGKRMRHGDHATLGDRVGDLTERAAVDATGIPPEKISFPHALAAVADSVMAGFSPSGS